MSTPWYTEVHSPERADGPTELDIDEALVIGEEGGRVVLLWCGAVVARGKTVQDAIERMVRVEWDRMLAYPDIVEANGLGIVREYGWDGLVRKEWA